MPAVDRTPTNERLCDPRLHGRNAGPRAGSRVVKYAQTFAQRRGIAHDERAPGVSYQVGELRQLMRPTTHGGWGAVLEWY